MRINHLLHIIYPQFVILFILFSFVYKSCLFFQMQLTKLSGFNCTCPATLWSNLFYPFSFYRCILKVSNVEIQWWSSSNNCLFLEFLLFYDASTSKYSWPFTNPLWQRAVKIADWKLLHVINLWCCYHSTCIKINKLWMFFLDLKKYFSFVLFSMKT